MTVKVLLLAILTTGCSTTAGPSASYLWGEKAGNSAVALVNAGMEVSKACQQSIQAAMMLGDEAAPTSTPPPKNFNVADAQNGCLATFHK